MLFNLICLGEYLKSYDKSVNGIFYCKYTHIGNWEENGTLFRVLSEFVNCLRGISVSKVSLRSLSVGNVTIPI